MCGLHPGDGDCYQSYNVAEYLAARPYDLDDLPFACQRAGDLFHPWVFFPRIGIDFTHQFHFGLERCRVEWTVVGIKVNVGTRWWARENARMTKLDHADRLRGPGDRRLGQFRSVGITGRFTGDRAKAKSLRCIVGRSLQPSIVEGKAFCLAVFEEQLAVICAVQRVVNDRLDTVAVHSGLGEEQVFVAGHWRGSRGLGLYIVMRSRSVTGPN